jgi:hypothetical protein
MCENEMIHISRAAGKCPAESPIGLGAYFIVLLCGDATFTAFHNKTGNDIFLPIYQTQRRV